MLLWTRNLRELWNQLKTCQPSSPHNTRTLHLYSRRQSTMNLGKWPTWRSILFHVFISILYMFRATSCSSSGESIVSTQHLAYVTLCRWPFRVQVGKELSDLHTKRSPTESDIYQMLYWYNWFPWWWARGCSKHVENWNKYIEKSCASGWLFTKIHKRSKKHKKYNKILLSQILPVVWNSNTWRPAMVN